MTRGIAKLAAVLALMAGGALIAGCDSVLNGSEEEGEQASEMAQTDRDGGEAGRPGEAARERSPRAERPGAPDPGGVPGRALDACREIAEDAPALSDAARDRIVRECEGAATGDEETIRRAAEAACDAAALAAVPAIARGPVADACKSALP